MNQTIRVQLWLSGCQGVSRELELNKQLSTGRDFQQWKDERLAMLIRSSPPCCRISGQSFNDTFS